MTAVEREKERVRERTIDSSFQNGDEKKSNLATYLLTFLSLILCTLISFFNFIM